MNWWGKLIGTGVGMFGGPIGALAGAAIGHLYDEDDPTPQNERKARILYLAYFFLCRKDFKSRWRNILRGNFNDRITNGSIWFG